MVSGIFEEDEHHNPPADEAALQDAEDHLGVKLPARYRGLLLTVANGGMLRNRRFRTSFATSWAPDHICIDEILGVGVDSFSLDGETGSRYMVQEWGYPDVGVVFAVTPSGGHDTLMLDYRECGPEGEPSVVYVDEDRPPREIASDFTAFLEGLETETETETETDFGE